MSGKLGSPKYYMYYRIQNLGPLSHWPKGFSGNRKSSVKGSFPSNIKDLLVYNLYDH